MNAASLKTVLGSYPHTMALKDGSVNHAAVMLDFQEVSPVHKAFAPMVRHEAYDLCELAIVTALQAVAYDRPVVLLPVVVASRFQRGCLIAHGSRPIRPQDLPGKRVGVRAYTQTTGMWVRSHLVEDFGLDIGAIAWVTHDAAHVEQYTDPAFVHHDDGDKSLLDMLRDGDIDAAILGNDMPKGDEFRPVFDDANDRDLAWWRKHRFMPINHMVAASRTVCERNPAAIRAAYALLLEAADRMAGDPSGPLPFRFGIEGLRGPVEFTIDACMRQGLLPRRPTVDEVFAPARRILDHGSD
ncbi:phosphate/phosphite/phosphonate ABC transporter substrate-binding protein [Luteibacter yeojuensis]|uniref:Phosphate/phosphite/phosphonate ABC transporter substrate-binding protein n=1 Tax=Luteibacter yeojuensis TaxID=345309 RepID=A0A7X5QSX8_9GAMM|nr:phosphate/phosphite/phosphonate ABC transporter substrate-binding protein [Luteibacter yeojuensis]NID14841.1 phosphate/phosphite/phosphonate ABC transporter substrate-binding protein [Luteibacter yeojuensis]